MPSGSAATFWIGTTDALEQQYEGNLKFGDEKEQMKSLEIIAGVPTNEKIPQQIHGRFLKMKSLADSKECRTNKERMQRTN